MWWFVYTHSTFNNKLFQNTTEKNSKKKKKLTSDSMNKLPDNSTVQSHADPEQ